MYVFPFSLKGHLDSLLAAFAQTGGRLVDHPSFPVFTGWCEQHADDLLLREPTNNTVDVVTLAHLNLSDLDLRDTKEMAEDEPISDEMRLAFITEQVRDALNGEGEPIRFTPTDVMVLGGAEKGVACLGFLYFWGDARQEASYSWQGFFESPEAFRVWLRAQKYLTAVEDLLQMPASERLAYWGKSEMSDVDEPGMSPSEIAALFDETDRTGSVPSDALGALERWYDTRCGGPAAMATWVARPPATEFDPLDLEGVLTDRRIDKLLAGASPTPDEIRQWQERRMRDSAENDGDYLHSIYVWPIEDDRGRQRLVAVLHRDPYTLERILGLFEALDSVSAALPPDGQLEWM